MENEIKTKLTTIIRLERQWFALEQQYRPYYSIEDFITSHEATMIELWKSYFGDIGYQLWQGSGSIIWQAIDEGKTDSEIVEEIYLLFWPEPEKLLAKWYEEREKEFDKQRESRMEKKNMWETFMVEQQRRLGISGNELIEIAQKVVYGRDGW